MLAIIFMEIKISQITQTSHSDFSSHTVSTGYQIPTLFFLKKRHLEHLFASNH